MKIYTLIHLQDTAITDADAMPFLTKDAAQVAMKAAWEEALKAAGIDPAEPQREEREWDCGEDTASIRIDFNSVYETWKITEHDLEIIMDVQEMTKPGIPGKKRLAKNKKKEKVEG